MATQPIQFRGATYTPRVDLSALAGIVVGAASQAAATKVAAAKSVSENILGRFEQERQAKLQEQIQRGLEQIRHENSMEQKAQAFQYGQVEDYLSNQAKQSDLVAANMLRTETKIAEKKRDVAVGNEKKAVQDGVVKQLVDSIAWDTSAFTSASTPKGDVPGLEGFGSRLDAQASNPELQGVADEYGVFAGETYNSQVLSTPGGLPALVNKAQQMMAGAGVEAGSDESMTQAVEAAIRARAGKDVHVAMSYEQDREQKRAFAKGARESFGRGPSIGMSGSAKTPSEASAARAEIFNAMMAATPLDDVALTGDLLNSLDPNIYQQLAAAGGGSAGSWKSRIQENQKIRLGIRGNGSVEVIGSMGEDVRAKVEAVFNDIDGFKEKLLVSLFARSQNLTTGQINALSGDPVAMRKLMEKLGAQAQAAVPNPGRDPALDLARQVTGVR